MVTQQQNSDSPKVVITCCITVIIEGRAAEFVEINKHIMLVRAEQIRLYDALREKSVAVTSTLPLNCRKGITHDSKIILQVVDYH